VVPISESSGTTEARTVTADAARARREHAVDGPSKTVNAE
jgi:hypothetical protein